MESVIDSLMSAGSKGIKRMFIILPIAYFDPTVHDLLAVLDMVKPPDLNQARINKCVIALVNRKVVTKDNSTVSLCYLFYKCLSYERNFRVLFCTTGKASVERRCSGYSRLKGIAVMRISRTNNMYHSTLM